MTGYKPTLHQDQSHTSASGIRQRGSILSLAAGIMLIAAVLEYLVIEAIAASAWKNPVYSYASNWISDLGVPGCSPFQVRGICSPLHNLMNTAFIVQGVLFLIASILLLRLFSRVSRYVYLVLVLIYSVGIILVGSFHESTTTNGTLSFHFLGAIMAILGGNITAIVMGFQWRSLEMPRWFGRTSIILGFMGVASAVVLETAIGTIPSGIPERVSVYTIILWQLLTGIVLLVGLRPQALSKINVAN